MHPVSSYVSAESSPCPSSPSASPSLLWVAWSWGAHRWWYYRYPSANESSRLECTAFEAGSCSRLRERWHWSSSPSTCRRTEFLGAGQARVCKNRVSFLDIAFTAPSLSLVWMPSRPNARWSSAALQSCAPSCKRSSCNCLRIWGSQILGRAR